MKNYILGLMSYPILAMFIFGVVKGLNYRRDLFE